MNISKPLQHSGTRAPNINPSGSMTIKRSELDPHHLIIDPVRITSLADYEEFITFLQEHRPAVATFYTPPEWTAEELLGALKEAYPRGLIFHPKHQSLLGTLNSNTRFYIVNHESKVFFSYGDCCREQQRLDCPPERPYALLDLIQDPNLTFTKL